MENTLNGTNGRFLGYPDCCIKAYGDPVRIMYRDRPVIVQTMAVNGYIPCEECAQKLADGTITYNKLINPRRKCSVPFTREEMDWEDRQTIEAELHFLSMDRIALGQDA